MELPEILEEQNLSRDEAVSEYIFLEEISPSEYGCPHGFAPWLASKIEVRKKQLCKMLMETFVSPKKGAHNGRN